MPTPPAVVDRDPARATRGAEQGIEEGPVGYGVRAIGHFLRFAEWRCDRTAIEMIAADDNRRFQFAAGDQVIEREAEFVALSVTEPANARRQTLESHALLRESDPTAEDFVLRKHLPDQRIGAVDIRSLARKRRPAERPASFAK